MPSAAPTATLVVMRVRLRFPAPGFFLNDPRLVVELDGRTVFDGAFKDGFDVSLDVAPGDHTIATAVYLLGAARRQSIPLALGAPGYRDVPAVEARLSYSRLSGNFDRKLSISTRAA